MLLLIGPENTPNTTFPYKKSKKNHSRERIQKKLYRLNLLMILTIKLTSLPEQIRKIELARYTDFKQSCFSILVITGTF